MCRIYNKLEKDFHTVLSPSLGPLAVHHGSSGSIALAIVCTLTVTEAQVRLSGGASKFQVTQGHLRIREPPVRTPLVAATGLQLGKFSLAVADYFRSLIALTTGRRLPQCVD